MSRERFILRGLIEVVRPPSPELVSLWATTKENERAALARVTNKIRAQRVNPKLPDALQVMEALLTPIVAMGYNLTTGQSIVHPVWVHGQHGLLFIFPEGSGLVPEITYIWDPGSDECARLNMDGIQIVDEERHRTITNVAADASEVDEDGNVVVGGVLVKFHG